MEVVIHGGTHKTGTTSFQNYLKAERDRLVSEGVHAFPLPRQVNVRNDAKFDPAWIKEKLDCANSAQAQIVLFSHEIISTFTHDQLSQLVELMGPYRTHYVVAFRHWSSYLRSRWMQNCSRRDSQSFQSFLARIQSDFSRRIDARFDLVVQNATQAGFDQVSVISYDNCASQGQSLGVCETLAGACGVPVPRSSQQPIRANKSAETTREADMTRLFNGARAESLRLEPNALFDRFDHCREALIPEFFDQTERVSQLLKADRDLAAELTSLLDMSMSTVQLPADDFAPWCSALEEVVAGSVVNPIDGKLFPEPVCVAVESSTLEWAELPQDLRVRMAQTVEAPAQIPKVRSGAKALLRRFR